MELQDMSIKEVVPKGKSFSMLVPPDAYDSYLNDLIDNFTTELISKRLHDGDIFIDTGAHYGFYTLAAGSSTKCRVISFEPSPASYEILVKNIEKNGLKNVESFNLALSDSAGIKVISIANPPDKDGFLTHQSTKVSVKTEALDHLLADVQSHQVIVRIDADGQEAWVLRGIENLLKNTKDVELFIKFNPSKILRSGDAPEDLLGMIDAQGFDIFFIEDDKRLTYKIRDINDWGCLFDHDTNKKDTLTSYA